MSWLTYTVIAVTLAVWLVVIFGRVRSNRAAPPDSSTAVHAIVVLAWLFWVLPSSIGFLQVGRAATQFTAAAVTTLQTRTQTAISAVLIMVCFHVIVRNLHRAPSASIGRLAAFLAPWFALIVVSGLNAGYVTGRQFVLFPIIGIAIWLASPRMEVVGTVGILGAATAGVSMLAALVTPLALVEGGAAGADKAILGSGQRFLAGPYSDANGFAITLALAAPCLLLVRDRRLRSVGLAVIALALVWAAGRTSLLAALAGFCVYVFAGRARTKITLVRVIGVVAAAVGCLLTVVTPFVTTDPHAFTSRGLIWVLSLSDWRDHHFWLGGGPMYYERSGFVSHIFSFKVVAGHNLIVDLLVRGGVVASMALALFYVVALQQALRLARTSAFPLAFVVTFAFLSWLEVPLNLTNLGFLGYASWLPLAVIAFTRTQRGEAEQPQSVVAGFAAVPA